MEESQRNVRRRLFQDNEGVNRDPRSEASEGENMTNSLLEEMKLEAEEARNRWNFDFEKEEPLPGRWEWVKQGEQSFENFGTPQQEDTEEYFLANEQLDSGEHSNDVFLDASNITNELSRPSNTPCESRHEQNDQRQQTSDPNDAS